jgi:hypothetical protein
MPKKTKLKAKSSARPQYQNQNAYADVEEGAALIECVIAC